MSQFFDQLVELKIQVLISGIDFSRQNIRRYLDDYYQGTKTLANHGLFFYHDSNKFIPNEIIVTNENATIRIETRSNINSNFFFDFEDNNVVIKNKKNNLVYKTSFVFPPQFYNLTSPKGFPLSKYISTMGSDSLRIYPKLDCDFDHTSLKCKFCGVNAITSSMGDDELLEEYVWAFSEANKIFHPKHLFISTGTRLNKSETNFFTHFFEEINKITGSSKLLGESVYVPAPVKNLDEIDMLFGAGLGMISFNLEVWDPQLFNSLCPGKERYFGRSYYFTLFEYCVKKYGRGSVKTNFVLGLEKLETIKEGITTLANMGCFSSGTIFYPTPGAILDINYQNPNINYYIEIFSLIAQVGKANGLRWPWSRESRISSLEWDILDYKNG